MMPQVATLTITCEQIGETLAPKVIRLIQLIVRQARAAGVALYLVGGVPRDTLLGRRTTDLDFVLEGDAIALARSLAAKHGGRVEAHVPFGTAKWILERDDGDEADCGQPAHIDFAMARRERYARPGALPTVSRGRLADDLARRDFSINAMALQPTGDMDFILIDPHGGSRDLAQGRIRVLHDGSFRDDPTRIYRALRFGQRFGFELEAATAALLREGRAAISALSGERIRNELAMCLKEDMPENALRGLEAHDLLTPVDAAFDLGDRLERLFARARNEQPPWPSDAVDRATLYWMLLFDGINPGDASRICGRLALNGALTKAIAAYTRTASNMRKFDIAAMRPSQITRMLDGVGEDSIRALWLGYEADARARERIERYMLDWRFRRATVDGECLKSWGLPAGPRFATILGCLRDAWLDGEVRDRAEEQALLQEMLVAARAQTQD